tara:strand:- start:136 stop:354 length:219 start_codon:yes stop_codon:yes gene_type:complete
MCIICVEFQSNKLTANEALKNLSEMQDEVNEEHAREVLKMIVVDSIRKNRRKPKSKNKSESESDEDWKYGSD